MNTLITEYRSLPPDSDFLPDARPNYRKCEIIRELDEIANDQDVSQLLLEILKNPLEFDLARVEAIQVAGIYIQPDNPLAKQIQDELRRIAECDDDEMLMGWAQRYVELPHENA
jgi:hypothetical protein